MTPEVLIRKIREYSFSDFRVAALDQVNKTSCLRKTVYFFAAARFAAQRFFRAATMAALP